MAIYLLHNAIVPLVIPLHQTEHLIQTMRSVQWLLEQLFLYSTFSPPFLALHYKMSCGLCDDPILLPAISSLTAF